MEVGGWGVLWNVDAQQVVQENKAAVCVCVCARAFAADCLRELKAAFLHHLSLGNLIQNLNRARPRRHGAAQLRHLASVVTFSNTNHDSAQLLSAHACVPGSHRGQAQLGLLNGPTPACEMGRILNEVLNGDVLQLYSLFTDLVIHEQSVTCFKNRH